MSKAAESTEIDVYIVSYITRDGFFRIDGPYQYLQDAEDRMDMCLRPNNVESVTITKRTMKVRA